MKDYDMIFHFKEDLLTGLALVAMNKNRSSFDNTNSVLDNFTGKKVKKLNLLVVVLCNFHVK